MSNEDTCHMEVATQPQGPTDCVTALILNSIEDVQKYCQFKLIIQSVLSLTHIDYLLHGHYLLTNVPSLSVICHFCIEGTEYADVLLSMKVIVKKYAAMNKDA